MLPKINFNGEFIFTTKINVRILDLNMGCHLSNDKVLNYLTEVCEQFLRHRNLSLNNVDNHTLAVAASYVRFKKEVFYPETLSIQMGIMEIKKTRIYFYYELKNKKGDLTHQAVKEMALLHNETGKVGRVDQYFG